MTTDIWLPETARDKWKPFRGNNHEFNIPTFRWGGGVSFFKHIGKPLTDELHKDLFERLCITSLRIYGPNSEQWTDGRFGGACTIYLDDNEFVTDIVYYP